MRLGWRSSKASVNIVLLGFTPMFTRVKLAPPSLLRNSTPRSLWKPAPAATPDGQHRARTPAPDEHAVHVHGVVVHVLPVAHVVPVLAAVEAPDDTADFDGAVELVGIDGIDRELQHTLGGVGPGSHGDFREANAHRNLYPVLAAVVAAEDLAVLVAGIEPVRIARIECQRPHRRAVIGNVELFPVLSVVRAAVGAVLRPDIEGVGVIRVRDNAADGGRLWQATAQQLPPVVARSHAIEAGLDRTAGS